MDIDEDGSETAIISKRKKSSSSSSSKKSSSGRVYKRGRRGKPSAAMTFFSVNKDKKGARGGRRKKMPRI